MIGRLLCIGIVAAIASASSARANILNVEATGTIYKGTDRTGVFVGRDASLIGYGIVLRMQFDTSLGTTTVSSPLTLIRDQSALGPGISATVTINGVSASMSGTFSSFLNNFDYGGGQVLKNYAMQESGSTGVSLGIGSNSGALPPAITSPYSFIVPATESDIDGGSFTIGRELNGVDQGATGYFNATSITLTDGPLLTAVPEPATWAMILLGFTAVGVAGYGRKSMAKAMVG